MSDGLFPVMDWGSDPCVPHFSPAGDRLCFGPSALKFWANWPETEQIRPHHVWHLINCLIWRKWQTLGTHCHSQLQFWQHVLMNLRGTLFLKVTSVWMTECCCSDEASYVLWNSCLKRIYEHMSFKWYIIYWPFGQHLFCLLMVEFPQKYKFKCKRQLVCICVYL